jgi:hypothetical protein
MCVDNTITFISELHNARIKQWSVFSSCPSIDHGYRPGYHGTGLFISTQTYREDQQQHQRRGNRGPPRRPQIKEPNSSKIPPRINTAYVNAAAAFILSRTSASLLYPRCWEGGYLRLPFRRGNEISVNRRREALPGKSTKKGLPSHSFLPPHTLHCIK